MNIQKFRTFASIIAIIAVLGFVLAACPNEEYNRLINEAKGGGESGGTPGGGGTQGGGGSMPGGGGTQGGNGETTVAVTGVSLNKTATTMLKGNKETITATVAPSNAANKTVTWSTSNAGIATVASGEITAIAKGTAVITVTTADGSKTAACNVTVSDTAVAVTSLALNKTSTSITAGNTEKLTATITPSGATNQNVTWSSSNTAIATVSGGTVTAVSAGTATITVTTTDGRKTATCTVTVSNNAVTLNSVSANGDSSTQTTTQLTLTFSKAITGLSANDITLTGVSGVSKGTLSASGATYTLPISGITEGGTLSVAVAKTGYTISGSPKTVTIYFFTIEFNNFVSGLSSEEIEKIAREIEEAYNNNIGGFKDVIAQGRANGKYWYWCVDYQDVGADNYGITQVRNKKLHICLQAADYNSYSDDRTTRLNQLGTLLALIGSNPQFISLGKEYSGDEAGTGMLAEAEATEQLTIIN